MNRLDLRHPGLHAVLVGVLLATTPARAQAPGVAPAKPATAYLFNDCHVHLTNYIQEGITAKQLLKVMGNQVGRSALFGIPLQQQWSYRVDGNNAPKYYLDSDSPLYYYSFTDAYIAMQYKSLSKAEQARFDPMITGFNPTDMYAADHIRRVLQTFPGVFTGIGEFTIHKEFVAAKIAGGVASLSDPALDRLLDFAADAGLLCLMHSDIAKPFPKSYTSDYLSDIKALFRRHPRTTIIWAHIGLGRIIHPIEDQIAAVQQILDDPSFNHVYFDISWDEVAKYAVASQTSVQRTADMLNRYPDRFLFGTDTVAPGDPKAYYSVYHLWDPVWAKLSLDAREKITKGNYERLFGSARAKVRAWEKVHATP
jgi:hypothetical protein